MFRTPSRLTWKTISEDIIGAVVLIALASAAVIPSSLDGKIMAAVAVVGIAALAGAVLWVLYRKRGSTSTKFVAAQKASTAEPWGEPGLARDPYPSWKAATVRGPQNPTVDIGRWSLELLNALEWKRFEVVCGEYFETLGFRVEVAREGADGGVDIRLYAEGSERPNILVQCKAWKAYKVGVKQLRELFGVMAADGVGEGSFVTTGTFTSEAREFARGKELHLIDGEELLRMISLLTQGQQDDLLKTATSGDFTTPTCPSCGIKMTTRVSKADSKAFWGCVNYPRCKSTLRVARA